MENRKPVHWTFRAGAALVAGNLFFAAAAMYNSLVALAAGIFFVAVVWVITTKTWLAR